MTSKLLTNRIGLKSSKYLFVLFFGAVLFTNAPCALAQGGFSSGSDGSDGAYEPQASGYFDPSQFHGSGVANNVFNFTTVHIPPGVTITFSEYYTNAPVYWLASGDVNIEGHLVLDGGAGTDVYQTGHVARVPSVAGPGGYGGGVGGSSSQPATAGRGPGGGKVGCNLDGNATTGTFTGSSYLVPLVGGSGGAGSTVTVKDYPYGSGGGAGGGAILIASDTQIRLGHTANDGSWITAKGGRGGSHDYNCNDPGGGSGGAIRLVANSIVAAYITRLSTAGSLGRNGLTRLEAYSIDVGGLYPEGSLITSTPYRLFTPKTPPPSVRVTSVDGMPITENPFSFPDVVINTQSPVPVVITGEQVPVGTIPTLYVWGEKTDQQLTCPDGLQPAGKDGETTCTINLTFDFGGTRGLVTAVWQPK